jgi:peptide/nickel transport system permease protein
MEAAYTYKSNWWGYVSKRLFMAVIAFIIISLLIFIILNYEDSPTGIFYPNFTKVELETLYMQLGIDTSPLVVRYFHWMGNFFNGNWGESYYGYSYYFK